jgi:uncharacterized damage-inducible protein DinB
MRVTEMDTLYAYNWWATSRVLAAAEGMRDDEFTSDEIVPIPFGNLRATLVHMMDLERSARFRLWRNATSEALNPAGYASIEALSTAWRAEATAMKDYLIGLEDEHMDSEFALSSGERYPFWQLLIHVLNHSTQHRSEAAVLLTALDRSPGDLDFSYFLRERRA